MSLKTTIESNNFDINTKRKRNTYPNWVNSQKYKKFKFSTNFLSAFGENESSNQNSLRVNLHGLDEGKFEFLIFCKFTQYNPIVPPTLTMKSNT